MDNFIYELEMKKVITKQDIVLLKKYISNKYINYTTPEKAAVLSKAVHQILDKNTQGLEDEYRKDVKQIILNNMILKGEQNIFLIDILDTYVSLQDKSDNFGGNLLKWINSKVENKIPREYLENYYSSINGLNNCKNTETSNKVVDHTKIFDLSGERIEDINISSNVKDENIFLRYTKI